MKLNPKDYFNADQYVFLTLKFLFYLKAFLLGTYFNFQIFLAPSATQSTIFQVVPTLLNRPMVLAQQVIFIHLSISILQVGMHRARTSRVPSLPGSVTPGFGHSRVRSFPGSGHSRVRSLPGSSIPGFGLPGTGIPGLGLKL